MPPLTWALLFALLTFTVALAASACAADPVQLPTTTPPPTSTPAPTRADADPNATPEMIGLIPNVTPASSGVTITPPKATEPPPTQPAEEDSRTTAETAIPTGGPPPTIPFVPGNTPVILTSADKSDSRHEAGTKPSMPGHPPDGGAQLSPIQAGEIDDNETWSQYLEYTRGYQGPPVLTTPLKERYLITVSDSRGMPIPGATVTVHQEGSDHHTNIRTHADGRAVHHPPAPATGRLTFTTRHLALGTSETIDRTPTGTSLHLTLPGELPPPSPLNLDVLFLLDATGSMADEIDRIKNTLASIGQQISDLPQNPALRVATIAYRDRGDDFVTRVYDFDDNLPRFLDTINALNAEGGGDYPESLNQALHEALTRTSWRNHSVKLVFLLADAPPHLDYLQDHSYTRETARAQTEGIRIFAVASSGLDAQGEYIFRQLAQQTLGKFIFILYETPPQGELTTPHDVGDDFSVEKLDSLIVRLITEELESMTQPVQSP